MPSAVVVSPIAIGTNAWTKPTAAKAPGHGDRDHHGHQPGLDGEPTSPFTKQPELKLVTRQQEQESQTHIRHQLDIARVRPAQDLWSNQDPPHDENHHLGHAKAGEEARHDRGQRGQQTDNGEIDQAPLNQKRPLPQPAPLLHDSSQRWDRPPQRVKHSPGFPEPPSSVRCWAMSGTAVGVRIRQPMHSDYSSRVCGPSPSTLRPRDGVREVVGLGQGWLRSLSAGSHRARSSSGWTRSRAGSAGALSSTPPGPAPARGGSKTPIFSASVAEDRQSGEE